MLNNYMTRSLMLLGAGTTVHDSVLKPVDIDSNFAIKF